MSLGGGGGFVPSVGGSAGTDAVGGSAGAGGTPQAGAAGSVAGSAGTPPIAAVCGNATREGGEQCDQADLGGVECSDLGFEGGSLRCDGDCRLVVSDCTGQEQCFDGRDNDGDRDIDCADDDCALLCSDSCSTTGVADENGIVEGTLVGRSSDLVPTCARSTGLGEVVYAVLASADGVIEARLEASVATTLSARYDCADEASEAACSGAGIVEVPVSEGETVHFIVEGEASDGFGFFELTLQHRTVGCGNAVREAGEGCDDGNTEDGDGCSALCEVESSEVESNRSFNRATPYVYPFFAEISDETDHDYVSFEVDEPPTGFRIGTYDFGDAACSKYELDSTLKLYAPDTSTLLAEDDDGGQGYCASLDIPVYGAEPGIYYVVVSSSPTGAVFQFPYILNVEVELCGNDILSPGEECDDGNREDYDGCSAVCTDERPET